MTPRFLAKLAVTLLLLVYLGFSFNWERTVTALADIRIVPYGVSYVVFLLCSIPLALRLRLLMSPTALHFTVGQLIRIHFVSQFYGLFLPSGIGQSFARWYQVTKNRVGRRVFAAITLIERMMLTLTLVLCVAIPLYFVTEPRLVPLRSSLLPVLIVLFIACATFFSCLLNHWCHDKFALLMRSFQSLIKSSFFQKLFGIYEDLGLYLDKRPHFIKAFTHHLVFQSLLFLRIYLVFLAVRVDLPAVTILWISMLVIMLLMIPITVAGIGLRESSFAGLLALYGIEREVGAVIGVLLSVQVLMNAGIGSVLNVIDNSPSAWAADGKKPWQAGD